MSNSKFSPVTEQSEQATAYAAARVYKTTLSILNW